MISENEEDTDDFPAENREKPAETLVGTYRAESTDQYTAERGITTKIPPLFDGSTSSFTYEELTDDWLDLTVLEAEKRAPALKNRLVGDAEMYKGRLDREHLKTAVDVEASLHPLEILSIHSSEKMKRRDGQVVWKKFIALETLKGFLDGHAADVRPERRAKTKPVSCRRGSGEC